MPTQIQIQELILSAQLTEANLVDVNLAQMQAGYYLVSWTQVRKLNRNITALQIQYDLADYTSANTLVFYDCLSGLIGFDTTVNAIDPNFQIPATEIVIVNPASYTAPIPSIPWSSFDVATQTGSGGRYIYYNTAWKGLNPLLSLTSPGEIALFLGTDYSLLTDGGIQLLPGGNLPYMFDGDILRATSYVTA